jgi:hypothetical protein
MSKLIACALSFLFLNIFSICHNGNQNGLSESLSNPKQVSETDKPLVINASKKHSIQVALLLDTSNSMDGLIDQAKSQLWKMVNKLAAAKKDNTEISMEIALFEYGNARLDAGEGYIRMVQSLGTDLDGVSEKLFQLKTNGGEEYCGWVVREALNTLKWSDDKDDMKVIIIAGNEPFDQGSVDYRQSCEKAAQRGIIVNTIHCGDYKTGLATHWKDGADIGKGKYLNINTDEKVIHIPTPWDAQILELNILLNKTYIGYGHRGSDMKKRQITQDANAASYGAANATQRALSKSKASSYKNEDWDVVDAAKADEKFVEKVKEEDLPAEWKGKSKDEIKKEIEKLSAERAVIQKELRALETKVETFQMAERKKISGSTQTLDNVLIQAVVEQAQAQGFKFN